MIPYITPNRIRRNGHPDSEFVVTWEVAVEAQNFVEAAFKARAIQKDSESTATCFMVQRGDATKLVDLGEDSTFSNPDSPDE